mmetsp:Transcript_29393/g.25974  ORF Transcript_29393/g.25974 Transcript_29393/m.25974 type:complete len:193 (+) Transcript_29393:105-683(+)
MRRLENTLYFGGHNSNTNILYIGKKTYYVGDNNHKFTFTVKTNELVENTDSFAFSTGGIDPVDSVSSFQPVSDMSAGDLDIGQYIKNYDESYGNPIYSLESETNIIVLANSNNTISTNLPCNLSPNLDITEYLRVDNNSTAVLDFIKLDHEAGVLNITAPSEADFNTYSFAIEYSSSSQIYYTHEINMKVSE